MPYITTVFLAIALSMDAFAVAVCKGLAMKKATLGKAAIVGAWFGGFQALMPLVGYFAIELVGEFFPIEQYDHWIALVLLVLIGANMIREALSEDEEEQTDSLRFGNMLMLAFATSIDAMASGAALPDINVFVAVSIIGALTFAFSAVGVKIGNVFGSKYEKRAEISFCILDETRKNLLRLLSSSTRQSARRTPKKYRRSERTRIRICNKMSC